MKTNSKLLMGVIAILVICNITLLATLWKGPLRHQVNRKPGMPVEFVNDQLHFSTVQLATFNDIHEKHEALIRKFKMEGKALRESFFENLKTNALNEHQVDSMADMLAQNHKKIELQTYAHFRDIRNMCDDKQKVVFDNIVGDILKRLPEQPHAGGQDRMPPPGDEPPPHP